MSYIRHHAIVVTGYEFEDIQRAYRQAVAFGMRPTDPVESHINGCWTLLAPPDGSKEGWDESDAGDHRRGRFIAWLDSQRDSSGFDWVEVQYGDEERVTKVTRHSDEVGRRGDDG